MVKKIVRGSNCMIRRCNNKATVTRKVRAIEQLDYKWSFPLCSKHKNQFKDIEGLVKLDFNLLANELILGKSKEKERQRVVNETFDYMQKVAKKNDGEHRLQVVITTAKHFARASDTRFLFGFYFGELFAFSSFKGLIEMDKERQSRAERLRRQMQLKDPYPIRERPDTSNELVDICKCGHEWFLHKSGSPLGACISCLCSMYEFEQRLTRSEALDLQSFMRRELEKQQNSSTI